MGRRCVISGGLAAVQLGIVPPDTAMVDMSTTDDWNALDEQTQAFESKGMAVYAGMIEAMDFHIGRLVAYLKSQGQINQYHLYFHLG